ncbi:adenosine deaminase/editase [Hypomontagnella submonticulosa]|nr:adenosine deaminase/editase [Hypomontagnella submonticulosa]
MTITADDIAALVQKHYDALPAKRKPVVRNNGLREWVPLAGIVAQGKDNKLWCLSLATGMKCLPVSKIPQAQGNVLHDWHAEVLAIRAFNRFVLDECKALAQGHSSEFLRRRTAEEVVSAPESREEENEEEWNGQPFAWKEDVLLYMYCSEAPCGDASMELIMAAQEDATPWDLPPATPTTAISIDAGNTTASLPGRAFFSQLGVVRRKPARSDALPTLSKSCSDKLALHQVTSLLSSVTTLLVNPGNAYLRTIVLPISRYDATSCRRAFSASEPDGRMRSLPSSRNPITSGQGLSGGQAEARNPYTFHPFAIETTSSEFIFSQRTVASSASQTLPSSKTENENDGQKKETKIVASNLAAAWTPSGHEEATLGGVLQGRKQSAADIRGASFASRRRMWELAVEVSGLLVQQGGQQGPKGETEEGVGAIGRNLGIAGIQRALSLQTYGEVKDCTLLESRRRAKEEARAGALKGWVRNLGDESFSLDN